MKRRLVSIITALALCLSLCPTWTLAAECDTQNVLPDGDSGGPYETGADTENLLDRTPPEDEQDQTGISSVTGLQAAPAPANAPVMAAEAEPFTYIDASGVQQTAVCTPLASSDSSVTLQGGWYVVQGEVTISSLLIFTGAAHLILADGCFLDAQAGIQVNENNSLTIYAQSIQEENMGRLNAAASGKNAGIGGAGADAGAITINGGKITAKGSSAALGGAGIGGAYEHSCGIVTINGGIVEAAGGSHNNSGAGIGSGNYGTGGTIIITGGTVKASSSTGTYGSAGIGDGQAAQGGCHITISGGNVTATGGGTGNNGSAGIGNGYFEKGEGSVITITGGTVHATGGPNANGIGIVDYNNQSACSVTISGGEITAQGGSGKDAIAKGSQIIGGVVNGVPYYAVTFTFPSGELEAFVRGAAESSTVAKPEVEVNEYTITWYKDAEYTEQFDFATPITSNTTLYAKLNFSRDYIASVSRKLSNGDARTTTFTSLSAAWDALRPTSGTTSGTLTVLKNVTTSQTLTVSTGMNVTVKMKEGVKYTNTGADCFKVDGGTLTLASGTVVENSSGKSVVYASSGTLNVEGGTYRSDSGNCLYVEEGVQVQLSGGTLQASDKALRYGNHVVKDMLKAGHAISKDGNRLPLSQLNGVDLAGGPYTVAACGEHDLKYTAQNNETHIHMCTYCGYSDTSAEAHNFGDDGKCRKCGFTAQAKVEIGGASTYYKDIDSAWASLANQTGTITLLKKLARSRELEVTDGMNVTVAMIEGVTYHNIEKDCFQVNQGGKLTLTTSCSVEEWRPGKSVVYAASGSTLRVEGGTYNSNENGFWIDEGADVKFSGGTITASKTALRHQSNNDTARDGVRALLADGFALQGSDSSLYSASALKDIGRLDDHNCTVVRCTHWSYDYISNKDGTHTGPCTYCEAPSGPVKCSYGSNAGDTGTCADCKSALTIEVDAAGLVYDGSEKMPGVVVKIDGQTVPAGQYTLTYAGNTAAGTNTASVTVTGTAFDGSLTKNFSIAKAASTVTGVALKNPAMEIYTITELDQIELTSDGTPGTVKLDHGQTLTKGTQAYRWTFTPDDTNYDTKTGEISLTVVEKSLNGIAITRAPDKTTYNYGDTFDPTGMTVTAEFSDGTQADVTRQVKVPARTLTVADTEVTITYGNKSAGQAITVNPAPLAVTGAAVTPKPYDTTVTATVSGVTFSGLVNGETLELGTDYTAAGVFADASAGEDKNVSVAVTLLQTEKANNYTITGGSVTTTGTIHKASVSITAPPAASEITYGKSLGDSVLTGGVSSVPGTFAWTDETITPAAGSAQYEVTFTPSDMANYNTGGTMVSVTVAKATPTITWGSAEQTRDYTGNEAEIDPPAVTLVNGEHYGGTVLYSYAPSGSASYTPGLPVNAGRYTVKAGIEEQNNYAAAESGEMLLSIAKVNYTGATTANTSGMFGKTRTYDLANLLPAGYELGTPAAADGIFSGIPAVNGTQLRYTLADNAGNVGKTGTITVPVTGSTNYNAFELRITVAVTNVEVPDLRLNPISVTYTGNPVPDSSISGTASVDGNAIDGTWSFAAGQNITNVADSGAKEVQFTPADTARYGRNTGTVTVTIRKAAPSLTLTPSPAALLGGGTVTLTLSGLPAGGSAAVTCSDASITVTKGSEDSWTAELPAAGASYTFTADYTGDDNHDSASTHCTVTVTARDEKPETKLEIKNGFSTVPPGLANIPELNTVEKLELAMRTAITQHNSGISQSSTAVYDVELQISTDGGVTWTKATRDNFPASGLTVTLPYPAGTNSSYTFTVVHMFTTGDFGKTPGDTETPTVTNTEKGMQFTVTGLSPISVGWVQPSPPVTPSTPSGGGGGGSSSKPAITSGPEDTQTVCDGGADCPSHGFTDLGSVETWYHEAVDFVLRNGLMNGYTGTLFGPDENLSRAQFAQILYNKEGRPSATGSGVFDDVDSGAWYAPAIVWAAGNGIVGGYGDGTFGPNDNITREQLAVMLWRYAGNPAATHKELHFNDTDEISGFAFEALRWAVENGVINGKDDGILDPKGLATRAQAAQMLKNFLDKK